MNDINNAFRSSVATWLKDTGTSVEELAVMMNCSSSALYKYICGETENITLSKAYKLSQIIGYKLGV